MFQQLRLFVLFLTAVSFSCGWHETQLPWKPSAQRKVKKETFYKFWERVVLEKLIPTDYGSWFKQFKWNPPLLEKTVGSNLSCPVISSKTTPSSVHRLTPADVKVVAAIGDSFTAGFGARSQNLADLYVEYRDIAWSIGGYGDLKTTTTLPNILKEYNPNIYGFSDQITAAGDFKKKFSGLNFAKSGATAEGAKERIEELISEMKEAKQIDFKRDWKIITMFIGNEDLCRSCFDQDFAPRNFAKKISKSLEKIQEKIPRVFVNLIQVFDVSKIIGFGGPYCKAFHKKICPCASGNPSRRVMISRTAKQYGILLSQLAKAQRFQNNPEFAVVLQPFLLNSKLPKLPNGKIDKTYFAPDCFHLSAKGHAAMATALWNNMLQPVGNKTTSWSSTDGLNCPRPDFPYFFTNLNSKQYYSRRPFNFYDKKGGPSVHKSIHLYENEKQEKAETEKKNETTIAVLVTSGFVIAAVAVGIAVHVIKRRNRPLIGSSSTRNYNTMEDETLM